MSKQSDALREYFKSHGIRQREVCEVLGLTPATISNLLAGRYPISKNVARRLADKYGLSFMFILTGDGTLIPPAGVQLAQAGAAQNSSGAGAKDDEVARLREQLEAERLEKHRLLGIIEKMAEA